MIISVDRYGHVRVVKRVGCVLMIVESASYVCMDEVDWSAFYWSY